MINSQNNFLRNVLDRSILSILFFLYKDIATRDHLKKLASEVELAALELPKSAELQIPTPSTPMETSTKFVFPESDDGNANNEPSSAGKPSEEEPANVPRTVPIESRDMPSLDPPNEPSSSEKQHRNDDDANIEPSSVAKPSDAERATLQPPEPIEGRDMPLLDPSKKKAAPLSSHKKKNATVHPLPDIRIICWKHPQRQIVRKLVLQECDHRRFDSMLNQNHNLRHDMKRGIRRKLLRKSRKN